MKHTMKVLKQLVLAAFLAGIVTTFFGCHTAHGFGRDVEETGEKIQEKTQ